MQGVLEAAFRQWGLPRVLRSDNGPPFAGPGLAGLSALSLWLIKLGIRPERIAKGKPQQNARLQRLHRTLKADTATPPGTFLRRVNKTGCLRWESGLVVLGRAYSGESVAIRALGDPDRRYWRLFFQRQPLALYDEQCAIFVPPKEAEKLIRQHGAAEDWHW